MLPDQSEDRAGTVTSLWGGGTAVRSNDVWYVDREVAI